MMILTDAIFGRKKAMGEPYNLIIGGMASTILSKSDLAARLFGVNESNITYFNLNGSDVEAFINIPYEVAGAGFQNNLNITKFMDYGDLCYKVNSNGLAGTTNMLDFILDGIIDFGLNPLQGSGFVGDQSFNSLVNWTAPTRAFNGVNGICTLSFPNLERMIYTATTQTDRRVFWMAGITDLYMPKLFEIGFPNIYHGVFRNINPSCNITVSSVLATNNSGNPDADLQYAIDIGCTIIYT